MKMQRIGFTLKKVRSISFDVTRHLIEDEIGSLLLSVLDVGRLTIGWNIFKLCSLLWQILLSGSREEKFWKVPSLKLYIYRLNECICMPQMKIICQIKRLNNDRAIAEYGRQDNYHIFRREAEEVFR